MINVYDFDKTIYDGDSSIDFFAFCIKKNKKCLLIIPHIFISMICYKLKIINKESFKSVFFSFIKYFNNIEIIVDEFWENNEWKIKKFYKKKHKKSDYIISASPEFLLKTISKKLSFNLIATQIDATTGKIVGKNCYGMEKVNRLRELGINKCNEFYSDSLSDLPLRKISKKGYIVKGEILIEWII